MTTRIERCVKMGCVQKDNKILRFFARWLYFRMNKEDNTNTNNTGTIEYTMNDDE